MKIGMPRQQDVIAQPVTGINADVGRPDLAGNDTERPLAQALRRSQFDRLAPLGDRVEVYSCHGAGSACSKSIGDRRSPTEHDLRRASLQSSAQTRVQRRRICRMAVGRPAARAASLRPPRTCQCQRRTASRWRGGRRPTADQGVRGTGQEHPVLDVRSILAFGGGHVPRGIEHRAARRMNARCPRAPWASFAARACCGRSSAAPMEAAPQTVKNRHRGACHPRVGDAGQTATARLCHPVGNGALVGDAPADEP